MAAGAKRNSVPLDDRAVAMGARMRMLRVKRSMTLSELAAKAGLSHPFLSLVERGMARPSMTSFSSILTALESDPIEFLLDLTDSAPVDVPPGGLHIVRGQGAQLDHYGDASARRLAASPRLPLLVEYSGANVDEGSHLVHHGDEFLYAIEGALMLHLGGGEHLLQAGDSVVYDAQTPHSWRSADGAPFRVLTTHS
ncbi:XRE family transcriptional regulator [Herbiconiux moechotypicola]|uniref:XRE family transcriptional regulator n=1 Tax=Herbiconiux moechotypicola TaxID=637393 RepID=A0ABN3DE51_9MICO